MVSQFLDGVEMTSFKDDFNGNKPLSPYSIRFTQEERQQLERMAHGISLSEFIRSCLFKENVSIRRTKGRSPVKDEQALARLIGVLGQSRIPNNINQLAKAANTGSLPVNPDTEKRLNEAYNIILWMRRQLIQALGLKAE